MSLPNPIPPIAFYAVPLTTNVPSEATPDPDVVDHDVVEVVVLPLVVEVVVLPLVVVVVVVSEVVEPEVVEVVVLPLVVDPEVLDDVLVVEDVVVVSSVSSSFSQAVKKLKLKAKLPNTINFNFIVVLIFRFMQN